MSGHGVERVGEGELVGQVEAGVQSEELEDVGVLTMRARGLRAGPPAVAEGAFAVSDPRDRARVGEAVLRNAAERWVDASASVWVAGLPRGTSGSCTMSTSSAVPAGGGVQARAGEMLAPNSLPRYRLGMGVPWSNAGLVRVKFSGACMSGRAHTSVSWPACRLRNARPKGFAGMVVSPFPVSLDAPRMRRRPGGRRFAGGDGRPAAGRTRPTTMTVTPQPGYRGPRGVAGMVNPVERRR